MKKPQPKGRRRPPQSNLSPADLCSFENNLYSKNISLIAGVDEAGRGPLAGPVVAAAVILPRGTVLPGLRDSKKLSPRRRDFFYDEIMRVAIAHGVGIVGPGEIDRINILRASLLAMRIAVEGLPVGPEYLLIDGNFEIDAKVPQMAITGGDDRSQSIAAASVVAKVTRDRMMCDFERLHPNFRFSSHKGYGTPRHYEELSIHGPTPIHRRTFIKKGRF